MSKAVEAVLSGKSIRRAALDFNVPRSTHSDRISKSLRRSNEWATQISLRWARIRTSTLYGLSEETWSYLVIGFILTFLDMPLLQDHYSCWWMGIHVTVVQTQSEWPLKKKGFCFSELFAEVWMKIHDSHEYNSRLWSNCSVSNES